VLAQEWARHDGPQDRHNLWFRLNHVDHACASSALEHAYYSLIKAFFFAGSITIIACYMGFNTKQGAEGVGKATTGAVVYSSILILLLDVLLAKILLKQ
jgi:ABC-type transporter Mla maintaining outer membrane lipid asymmetry permease subunit MlaE